MENYLLIAIVSLFGSLLTFYSGFGLGTLLLPVFCIFFNVQEAVALTAIVHLLNNVFKFFLVGKYIDVKILLRFGVPSLIASFIGAYILISVNKPVNIYSFELFGLICNISLVNLFIGSLIIFFAFFEIMPYFKKLAFSESKLVYGGLISGFFGGLSGHQGALRSAFLTKLKLSKEQFVATGISVALMVDVARLIIYGSNYNKINFDQAKYYLLVAVLSAFIGAYFGNKFLKKTTYQFVQKLTSILLILFALAMIFGLVDKK